MKNIIDIYEGILTKSKDKVGGVKKAIDFLSLKHLDGVREYEYLFDVGEMESIVLLMTNMEYLDRKILAKKLKEWDKYVDDNIIDFFITIWEIGMEHPFFEYWFYCYPDKSAATAPCDVMKPAFKDGKIYTKFDTAQMKWVNCSPNMFKDFIDSEEYVALYDHKTKDKAMWWFWCPRGLNPEQKIFMKSYIRLMVKYNK